ncbi:MAG: nicotinate (nicotinamide) nucleotide adenylyltransferase [Gammaproteobacteria bacterium]|nr:nicotinate (nicotinamide) nucleotide adenylyltransferase [Gammaproteobacteria bacterium]|tara:strand:+ start:3512 stop:4084 length:573 start_codon:yes stop_codon:yes gene_type:complete
MTRNLGIFGGAFDPIHLGHILPVNNLCKKYKFEKVFFVPSNISNSSKKIIASAEQRLKMLEISLSDYPNFIVDDREIKRGGVSYSYDTILEISQDYKDYQIFFIIGQDLLKELNSWKSSKKIFELCSILVTNRSSKIIEDEATYDSIFFEDTPKITASSTIIRNRLMKNEDVSDLVNKNLADWFKNNKVY